MMQPPRQTQDLSHIPTQVRRFSRRDLMQRGILATASLTTGAAKLSAQPTETNRNAHGCTLGFSTYGMKSLSTEDAIKAVASIGFDAIELTVRPDWDAAPARLTPMRRKKTRQLLNDHGLHLCSLMEHLVPAASVSEHGRQLDRLNRVCQLANDLGEKSTRPLVQTVLGGGDWKDQRRFLVERLGDWLRVAEKHNIVIAIKPHRGGAMSTPADARWIIEQLESPDTLRMVYDYSHYAFRDMPLNQTIATALPFTAHVAVKDPVKRGNQIVFQLPGEARTIDFANLIRQFYLGGYRGDFNCEVSGMVWSQAGYDPRQAAERSYDAMNQAFLDAEVPRIRR